MKKMPESCNLNTCFSTLVLSKLILFCSFVFSHPLYLSYFLFFSPYIFNLISFLSPLFITTLLLVLVCLAHKTTSLVPFAYISLLQNDENEFHWLDHFDVYEIVFGSVNDIQLDVFCENQVEKCFQELENDDSRNDDNVEKDSVPDVILENSCTELGEKRLENSCTELGEKRLENFLKILGKFEKMSSSSPNVVEKKTNKVVEKPKIESMVKVGSDAKCNKVNNDVLVNVDNSNEVVLKGNNNSKVVKSQSQRVSFTSFDSSNETLTSYGSMRKEKEWKRTLACKLFEERHNGDGREGMDSLWESYENDSVNGKSKNGHNKIHKNKKKGVVEDEGHDGDEIGAPLCCLQALKLSAGKMNLGMKKPSLVKISKAIKGLGWLHGVTKHSKKVHNNVDRSY